MGLNAGTLRLLGNAFIQALRDSFADNVTQWAAAIAYYSFLSLFPLLLAAVSLSAYFVSPDWAVGKAILLLREFVPEGDDAVQRIIRGCVECQRNQVSFGIVHFADFAARVGASGIEVTQRCEA